MSGPSETETGAPPLPGAPAREGRTASEPPIDRAAALAEGAPGIPLKFVYWGLGVVLVLSLGGLLGEHVFSSAGLNPVPTTTPAPVATTVPADAPTVPSPDRSVGSSLASFMGLSAPTPRPAPPFSLTDQGGQPVSVPGPASPRGDPQLLQRGVQ